MTCAEIEDVIEAVAAEDATASPEFRAHVEACVRCASALARARRIEQALAARPAPAAPPRFAAAVASRIRNERWQSEQQVDRVFNIALVAGVLAVLVGAAALFNVSAVAARASAAVQFFMRPEPAAMGAAPTMATYLMGSAFLGTALFVWWWAERRLSP